MLGKIGGKVVGAARQGARVLFQAAKDLINDSGPEWGAAIDYYALISTFPLLLAIAIIASQFVETDWVVEKATAILSDFVPLGVDEIEHNVREALAARGPAGIISVLVLLWTGSWVFNVIARALNIAYVAGPPHGFFKQTAISLLMMLTLGAFFLVALSSGPVLNFLWERLPGLPPRRAFLSRLIYGAVPAVLLLGAFLLTYRFVPRRIQSWLSALAGAGTATLLVMVAQPLFASYVMNFGRYNLIYGSVGMIVILLLWAWLTAVILLFGGEVAAHVQAMIFEGKSAAEVEKKHLAAAPDRAD
jgi:membrane protein